MTADAPRPPGDGATPSAVPVAAALALLALPVAGLGPALVFPSTPLGYLRVAALLCALAWLAAGRAGAVALAVATTPFLAFGAGGAPHLAGALVVPGLGLALALAVAVAAAGRRALLALAGASAVLAFAGLVVLPDAWNPARAEGAARTVGAPAPASASPRPVRGWRAGAAVRADGPLALAQGTGPWWTAADVADVAAPGPFVLRLDGQVGEIDVRAGVGVFVPGARAPFASAFDLDAFDAAVVLPGAWDAGDPAAREKADALAAFVRRGGLLLGPGPDRAWPEPLGRRLGTAGQATEPGLEGARRHGLGRVVRASSEAEALAALAAGAWAPDVGTVFDRATIAPVAPPAFAPWTDEPSRRRPQGLVLLGYAVLLGAFDLRRRGPLVRALGFLGPAAAATIGLWLAAPATAEVRVHAAVLDLGGAGGRRVEVACLRAGPAGWLGTVRWRGGGVVRMLGAEPTTDGRYRLDPEATAWTVRETLATGRADPGDREDRHAGFLAGFVAGRPPPERLRFGRGAVLPLEVEGVRVPDAWTLLHRP